MVRNEIGKKEMMNRPASRLIPFDELNMKYRNWFFFFFFSSVCVCVWNIKWFPYHRSIYWEWNNNQTGKKELTKLLLFFFSPQPLDIWNGGGDDKWQPLVCCCCVGTANNFVIFLGKRIPDILHLAIVIVVVVGGAVVHLMMMMMM